MASEEQPKRRRGLRALAWLAAVLIVLIVIAYFVVTSPAFIKGVILPQIGNSLNARISAIDISFHPFKQIQFRNLKVQAIGQAPVLVVPDGNIRYHLWDILGGNIHVDEMTLDSPKIEIVENPDGGRNVDPILNALRHNPARRKPVPSKPGPSKPLQVDLGKLTLRNASIVEIRNFGDRQSNMLELTNLNLTLSNLKNGQSAVGQLSAALWVNNNPPNGTNGFLAATLDGHFDIAMTAGMAPASGSGKAQFNVSSAHGLFESFTNFDAELECDATSEEVRQFDLHFQRSGVSLGELAASGPLNLSKMEGSLQLVLRGVDRQLLNLAGTAAGLDFGSTALSSTNEINLANSGKTIAAIGHFRADQFQITRAGRTTPALNLNAGYAVTVDNTAKTALLKSLTLTGTQQGHPLLDGRLSQPMGLAWGNAAGSAGNSTLDLTVTNLNLADWRLFTGDTVSGGNANLHLQLSSLHDGRQLAFDLNSQIDNLAAQVRSNRTFEATVNLQAQGQAADFRQFDISKYRLQIVRQNEPLLTALGSGTYDSADANADLQVAIETSLPGLAGTFPSPNGRISSGVLKLDGRIIQTNRVQTVTGRLTLTGLTGQFGKNTFNNFSSTMDLEIHRTPKELQIKRLSGALAQDENAGGNFAVTGVIDSASNGIQLNANFDGLNENGLRPFLEPMLTGRELVSISLNGNASVQYSPDRASSIESGLQVTNLFVRDPSGQFPGTPLAATLQMDALVQNQTADVRQFQIGLTPTVRAENQIRLQGRVDFSRTNVYQGNLKLSSDGLDLTAYHDLFAGGTNQVAQIVAANANPAPSKQASQPKTLPFRNFLVTANIRRLYLDEVAVTNFQTTVKLDGGHVLVKPFQLALNGAPLNASLDLDLSVPGYKYDFAADADGVPLAPLMDTFMPERRGELGGTLTAHAHLADAGTIQNLSGQFDVNTSNLNLSVVNVHSQILKTLINVVATVPQLISSPETAVVSLLGRVTGLGNGGLMNQLHAAPIQTISARGSATNGVVDLQSAVVQSGAFEADASGIITLAPAFTNSVIDIPITVSLSRSIAGQLNLAAAGGGTGAYVTLPEFLKMTRTLGDPKPEINKLALAGITVQSLGNSLKKPAFKNPIINQILRQVK